MRETSKCFGKRRLAGHFHDFLRGAGIDVGAGDDPLVVPNGTVRAWDVADGDGQMMAGVPDASYDFVYSSHCLEHMRDVPEALHNWTRILRPDGHLYLVVPDYLLYEKLTFPSRYNADHKHTFSLDVGRSRVGRANHWTIRDLAPHLPAEMILATVEDDGFDYSRGTEDQTLGTALSQICVVARKPLD